MVARGARVPFDIVLNRGVAVLLRCARPAAEGIKSKHAEAHAFLHAG